MAQILQTGDPAADARRCGPARRPAWRGEA